MGGALVLDQQVAHLALNIMEDDRAAAALVKAFQPVAGKVPLRIQIFQNVVDNESCALGRHNPNGFLFFFVSEDGYHTPVKVTHRVVDAHNVGSLVLFTVYCAVVQRIPIARTVRRANRHNDLDSGVFTEQFVFTTEIKVTMHLLYINCKSNTRLSQRKFKKP